MGLETLSHPSHLEKAGAGKKQTAWGLGGQVAAAGGNREGGGCGGGAGCLSSGRWPHVPTQGESLILLSTGFC